MFCDVYNCFCCVCVVLLIFLLDAILRSLFLLSVFWSRFVPLFCVLLFGCSCFVWALLACHQVTSSANQTAESPLPMSDWSERRSAGSKALWEKQLLQGRCFLLSGVLLGVQQELLKGLCFFLPRVIVSYPPPPLTTPPLPWLNDSFLTVKKKTSLIKLNPSKSKENRQWVVRSQSKNKKGFFRTIFSEVRSFRISWTEWLLASFESDTSRKHLLPQAHVIAQLASDSRFSLGERLQWLQFCITGN